MNFWTKFNAYRQLGWRSIRDVLFYRIGLKIRLHPVLRIKAPAIPVGDFFGAPPHRPRPAATSIWQEGHWAFGRKVAASGNSPPDWHTNLISGTRANKAHLPWDKITAFDANIGDIKTIWEASRFDWALTFAQQAAGGDNAALAKLNHWLRDWTDKNPAYLGPNWMCGQEASLRAIHLILAATLLDQDDRSSPQLEALLLTLLRRIKPTIAYARGQDNNHATSEAMALFVGGMWLHRTGGENSIQHEGAKLAAAGRAFLEERAEYLIFADGGFAQYSIVYHRLMLDCLSLSEFYRRRWNGADFSAGFYAKARAASKWLVHFTDGQTGAAPNMGSNDGAFLLPIGPGLPRDFRPSCAFASTLFEGGTHFADAQSASSLLDWLDMDILPANAEKPEPLRLFEQSAIISLSKEKTRLYLRLPGSDFRPHQADALHLDLWHGSENLLQDAGTYSYGEPDGDYYPSTAAHNSIGFDGRDQMPRAGRFLFAKWLRRGAAGMGDGWASAEYSDDLGNSHKRMVTIETDTKIIVTDVIDGPFKQAKLYWRLSALPATIDGNSIRNSKINIAIEADNPDYNVALNKGHTSLSYLEMEEIPVGEITINGPATVRSTITII